MKSPAAGYYGGKSNLAKEVLRLIPEHESYVEPFFGGGSIFFAKKKSKLNIINDSDSFVTNFWTVFFDEDKRKKLIKKLDSFIYSEVIFKHSKEIKENQNNYNEIERAWAFFVLVRMSFSGNIDSGFGYSLSPPNTIVKKTNNRINYLKHLKANFRKVIIFNRDALKVIDLYKKKKEAFFYLDPPYFNSHMGHYKGYNEKDFENLLNKIKEIKGKFLLSCYPSFLINKYIKKNKWIFKEIRLLISAGCNNRRRKDKTEVLVYNFDPLATKMIYGE